MLNLTDKNVKTFTLYRADVHNPFESGNIAVFDTFYHLDGDINNWDTKEEYILPEGWSFEDGGDEDFSYLTTNKGEVIEAQNISYSKTEDKPCCYYSDKKGVRKVFFEKADNNNQTDKKKVKIKVLLCDGTKRDLLKLFNLDFDCSIEDIKNEIKQIRDVTEFVVEKAGKKYYIYNVYSKLVDK